MRELLKQKARLAEDALAEARSLRKKNEFVEAEIKLTYAIEVIGSSYVDSVSLDDSDQKLIAAKDQISSGKVVNGLDIYEKIIVYRLARLKHRVEAMQ